MKRHRYLYLFLFVFFISFAAYLKTLAPSIVTEGDSGEFITCIGVRGVPHEPGYASFLLFAAALASLAPGGLEWGLNLSSALAAALASGLLAVLFLRLAGIVRGGEWPLSAVWLATLAFAFSLSFWEQAVITEVYACTVLLLVALMHLALSLARWRRRRDFLLFSLLLGFGFNVHYLVTLVGGPCWLYFFFRYFAGANPSPSKQEPRAEARGSYFAGAKLLLLGAISGWIGFSTNVYLPLAAVAHPPINFGDPAGLRSLLAAISRASYEAMAFKRPFGHFLKQIAGYLYFLSSQFPWYFFPLAAWGFISLFLRRRRWALASGGLYLLFSLGLICLINYGDRDSTFYQARVFFIPGYLVVAAWLCFALGDLYQRVRGRIGVKRAALALVCLGLLSLFHLHGRNGGRLDKSRNYVSYDYGRNMLAGLPGKAIVCTEGDNSLYPLFYFKYVHDQAREVVLLHPGMFSKVWYLEMLRREHPRFEVYRGMTLGQAVYLNSSLAPVYFVSVRRVGNTIKARPLDLLYRMEGREMPPAGTLSSVPVRRWLNDTSVPKDWREQSIIATYSEWFLKAGTAAEAEGRDARAAELYREGLSIKMGVINYSRVMHSKLHLQLSRLYGKSGRMELAREHVRLSEEAKALIDPKGP